MFGRFEVGTVLAVTDMLFDCWCCCCDIGLFVLICNQFRALTTAFVIFSCILLFTEVIACWILLVLLLIALIEFWTLVISDCMCCTVFCSERNLSKVTNGMLLVIEESELV